MLVFWTDPPMLRRLWKVKALQAAGLGLHRGVEHRPENDYDVRCYPVHARVRVPGRALATERGELRVLVLHGAAHRAAVDVHDEAALEADASFGHRDVVADAVAIEVVSARGDRRHAADGDRSRNGGSGVGGVRARLSVHGADLGSRVREWGTLVRAGIRGACASAARQTARSRTTAAGAAELHGAGIRRPRHADAAQRMRRRRCLIAISATHTPITTC